MEFVRLPYPYSDFCIFNLCKESALILNCIQQVCHRLDAKFKKYQHADGSVTVVLYFNESTIDCSTDEFSLLSGIAISKQKVLLNSNRYKISDYMELDRDFGQFTALLIDKYKISYKTDNFGSGHIYYYENKNDLYSLVSNRSHLLKIILDELNVQLTLNKPLVVGTFFSNFHFFTQQSFLSNELVYEINLLRLDEEIYQKSGKIYINKNQSLVDMFDFSSGNYESLLDDFCEKSINNMQIVFASECFKQHILDLSGGKDSRLCLALLLNTGHNNKISILTNDVPKSDDLTISAGITNLLNLQYITNWNSNFHPQSLDEGFNLWRSYFFGNYHRMGFAAWSPQGENLQDVRISGASGGIYRSTWSTSTFFQKALDRNNNLKDVLHDVIRLTAISGRYQQQDLDEVLEALYSEFCEIPGKNIEEKIDNHYLFHRNRSHFGLRGFSFYNECLTLTPLLSIQLFKASRLLTQDERQNYKIFYDLYKKLAPFLLSIRFDRDNNPFGDLGSNMNQPLFHLDENIDKWKLSQEQLLASKNSLMIGKPKMRWSEYLPTLKQEIEVMREGVSQAYPTLLPLDFDNRIDDNANTREVSIIYSQLSSIYDSLR